MRPTLPPPFVQGIANMAQPQENSQPVSQPQQARNDAAALDAAFPTRKVERRQTPRLKYQVVATLEPVASGPDDVCVVTRDADARGAGFLSSGDLPEGSRAVLHLPAPDGQGESQRIECRVRRSREVVNGLFEGSVEFYGDQPQFSDTRIRPIPAPRSQPYTG
jgi:hypothetical protein